MFLKAVLIWVLLSIVIAAVLCRLIHNAKVADRALQMQKRDGHLPGHKVGDVSNSPNGSKPGRRVA